MSPGWEGRCGGQPAWHGRRNPSVSPARSRLLQPRGHDPPRDEPPGRQAQLHPLPHREGEGESPRAARHVPGALGSYAGSRDPQQGWGLPIAAPAALPQPCMHAARPSPGPLAPAVLLPAHPATAPCSPAPSMHVCPYALTHMCILICIHSHACSPTLLLKHAYIFTYFFVHTHTHSHTHLPQSCPAALVPPVYSAGAPGTVSPELQHPSLLPLPSGPCPPALG